MTQTVITHSQPFSLDHLAVRRFRETLFSQDQQALDELLEALQSRHPATAPTGVAVPVELLLIALLLEQHKTLQFLVSRLNYYDQKLYLRRVKTIRGEIERQPSQPLG